MGAKFGHKISEKTRKFLRSLRLGTKLSEEHKRKISEKIRGEKHPFYGKHHTEESKRKMRFAKLGTKQSLETRLKRSKSTKGEKSGGWRGGIYPEHLRIRATLEYRLWREAVFQRDNYTCIWCGDNKGGNLEADHIKPFCNYPELRFAIDNGRTLCHTCHKKTETYGNNALKL